METRNSPPKPVVIVGCGTVGRMLAQLLGADRVTGVVRSADSAARLHSLGIESWRADLDAGGYQLPAMAGGDCYYFVPPPSHGREDSRLAGFLARLDRASAPRRVVLISTTGVYGGCGGAWGDEQQPVRPQADRAWRRWDAEQRLRRWGEATGSQCVILRVAGIYGPEQLPEQRLRRGEPMVAAAEAPWTNRIHCEDLAAVCRAAMQSGRPGAVYNVADGDPRPMSEYFDRVADALGLPRPPRIVMAQADSRLSAGMRSYLAESRRIDNGLMLRELGVRLRYPTLEQGLRSVIEARAGGRK